MTDGGMPFKKRALSEQEIMEEIDGYSCQLI